MNRRQRRAAAARARSRERNMACHTAFYLDYIAHLPQLPINEPLEPGTVNYVVTFHDENCGFYSTNSLADCTCNPTVARYVDPARS